MIEVKLLYIIVNSLDWVIFGMNGWIINGVLVWFMKMFVVVDIDFVCDVFSVFCRLLLRMWIIYCIIFK